MSERNASRNLTRAELVLVSVTLLVFLVPMFLLTVFPDVKGVRVTLGEGRVFVWWGVLTAAFLTNRKRIDRFFERWEREAKHSGK